MALKDWKKVKKNLYRNSKKPYDLILYKAHSSKNSKKIVWKVQIGSRTSITDFQRHEFTTYIKALNYAKDYMKKH